MRALPELGATVRCRGGGVGQVCAGPTDAPRNPQVFVRWPAGGGMWVTANEIEEVLPDGDQSG